ncbi:MAG: hypothetical protein ABI158_02315 [Edaphobacter sp.]
MRCKNGKAWAARPFRAPPVLRRDLCLRSCFKTLDPHHLDKLIMGLMGCETHVISTEAERREGKASPARRRR